MAVCQIGVVLDGGQSYDPDGEIVEYMWKRIPDNVIIYQGPDPVCTTRALGRVEEVIELTVTDNDHDTASSTVRIVNALVHELKEAVGNLP